MNPLTQFKNITNIMKTKILRNILVSVGAFFALAISTHAQNLYVSINGDFCGFHCTNSNGSISEYTPAGVVTIASSLARPRGLAFDSSGNLFAAVTRFAPPRGQYQGKILKFTPRGQQSVLGTVPQSFLEVVVTDSGGNIFALATDGNWDCSTQALSTNSHLMERVVSSAPFLVRVMAWLSTARVISSRMTPARRGFRRLSINSPLMERDRLRRAKCLHRRHISRRSGL